MDILGIAQKSEIYHVGITKCVVHTDHSENNTNSLT